jgi:hypothetical protein
MTFHLSNDIWREIIAGRFLDVGDICKLCSICSFFRNLFASSIVWQKLVEKHCSPFSLVGLQKTDWKEAIAAVFPRMELLRTHVALLHVARLAALPGNHPEAVTFFLYIYWSGEKIGAPRILKISPDSLVDVDLVCGNVSMHTGATSDLPLVCYGWSNVNSLIEVWFGFFNCLFVFFFFDVFFIKSLLWLVVVCLGIAKLLRRSRLTDRA